MTKSHMRGLWLSIILEVGSLCTCEDESFFAALELFWGVILMVDIATSFFSWMI
jgi:hypothetical protein